MLDASPLKINPNLTIEINPISEGNDCVVVDNFLADPDKAVAYASQNAAEFSSASAYPGVIYPPEALLMDEIYRFIRKKLNKPLSFHRGSVKFSTYFAMASLSPDELTCLQRLCHTDPKLSKGRRNIAALLYLFNNPSLGGTGFYRWKEKQAILDATAISQETPDKVLPFLQEKFETFRAPAKYITQSNEIAELLQAVPARFNRLIVYAGDIPHSAFIEEPDLLTTDVSTGRLTLNCFANVLAAQPVDD
ncbi:MAG: DUF6445 family protein [Pseudomonadales bacterium]|nr:DUF6445 family protein [Pseudomonadales bacterium]